MFFRDVVELKEAIRIKEAEGDAYISDIEVNLPFPPLSVPFLWVSMKAYDICIQTIGQAYEDMQTQNQHLLEQLADREDFNIKVFISSCFNPFYVKTANPWHTDAKSI